MSATDRLDRPLLTLFTCGGMLPYPEVGDTPRLPFDLAYGVPHPGLRYLPYHAELAQLVYHPAIDEPFQILAAVDQFVAGRLGVAPGLWTDVAEERAVGLPGH